MRWQRAREAMLPPAPCSTAQRVVPRLDAIRCRPASRRQPDITAHLGQRLSGLSTGHCRRRTSLAESAIRRLVEVRWARRARTPLPLRRCSKVQVPWASAQRPALEDVARCEMPTPAKRETLRRRTAAPTVPTAKKISPAVHPIRPQAWRTRERHDMRRSTR